MQRDHARRARRAAIERAVQWPLLAGTAVVGLALGWLAGWPWWPWAIGASALVLLALVGARRRLGVAYTAAATLLVVDAGLLSYIVPWWWVLLAGIGALGFAAVAGVRLGWWQRRRTRVLATAMVGLVLLVTSTVVLAVHAAQAAEVERQQLAQAHEQAVARILPRTPASMVNFLAERIARPTAGRGGRRVFRVQRGRAAATGGRAGRRRLPGSDPGARRPGHRPRRLRQPPVAARPGHPTQSGRDAHGGRLHARLRRPHRHAQPQPRPSDRPPHTHPSSTAKASSSPGTPAAKARPEQSESPIRRLQQSGYILGPGGPT
jgi:hypothetical protein